MDAWHGWAGWILDVDLTSGAVLRRGLPREWAIQYIGGSLFGCRLLYDLVGPEVDALSPENVVIIGQGPLGGTLSPAAGRTELVTKSPLTGLYLRSNAGGFFGPELKWAGYDLLILRGRSPHPVYLSIKDDEVELRDAQHLWGLDTWVTEERLREELRDPATKTLKIGPAGERLCRSAAVIVDLARAAAKGGSAAVLGSKQLKAIAVRGTRGVKVAQPAGLIEVSRALWDRFKRDPMYDTHVKYGTNTWVGDTVMNGMARAMGRHPGTNLTAASFAKLYEKNLSCSGCELHCSHFYRIPGGKYAGVAGEGVEGNTQLVGSFLGVNDAAFVCAYNNLCNQLGLDTGHPAAAIHWGMTLYRHGIITRDETDGIELTPGNEEAILTMVRKIASREGIGEILDAFPLKGAAMLGRGSDRYISHGKGLPSHGPGFMSSTKTTLAHAVATRGHDHLTGSPGMESPNRQPQMTLEVLRKVGVDRYGDPEMFTDADWTFKPKYAQRVFECENLFAMSDMTGTCKFAAQEALFVEGIGMADFARLLTVVTGVRFEVADLVRAAEREFALERAFNAREGVRRIDDYPYAYRYELTHGQPHPDFNPATFRLSLGDFDKLLDEYYRLRGCTKATGIPERAALCSLGLQDVADDLETRGLLAPRESAGAARGTAATRAPTLSFVHGPLGSEGLR